MRLLRLALFSVLALMPLPTIAQSGWEILLYDSTQIHILTAHGVTETLAVPLGAEAIDYRWHWTPINISPDRRYLVYARQVLRDDGAQVNFLQIANLADQSCCVTLSSPFEGYVQTVIIGPFSPDGTEFAALFAGNDPDEAYASSVVTIEVESWEVTAQLAPLEAPELSDVGVIFGSWDEDGIRLLPTCLACDGGYEGEYVIWNPTTGELTPGAGYASSWTDILPVTGERLVAASNPNFLHGCEPALGPSLNVVEYLPAGRRDDAVVAYYNSAVRCLSAPYWVIDGQAYLLFENRDRTLVFRDGTLETQEIPTDALFITGTPDGWLLQHYETNVGYYYQYIGGHLSVRELARFANRLVVLEAPRMGVTAAGEMTPVIR